MAGHGIGEVEIVPYETKHIEWRIPHFFANQKPDLIYKSPTFPTKHNDSDQWHLRLWPWIPDNEYILIVIRSNERDDKIYTLGYCFGLKKCDGTMEELNIGSMNRKWICSPWESLIKKTELLDRKTELAPSDILTVTCTIKWRPSISHSPEPTLFDKSKSLKLTRLDKLSANFKDLYTDKESCDVILKVKNKEYKAHRLVLMTRCSVFAATFKHDTLERQTGIITISDCDPDSFEDFMQYLYSGKLEALSFRNALNLYYTSDKYDIEELKEFCIEQLKQCLTIETVCEIAAFADKYDETQLFSIVQDFFNVNSLNIFLTSEWKYLLKNNHNLVDKLLTGMATIKIKT